MDSKQIVEEQIHITPEFDVDFASMNVDMRQIDVDLLKTAISNCQPEVGLIAAMNNRGYIGKDNKLMYSIKEDMQHFIETTKNTVTIMGRKTWESIGRVLPKRFAIVVSTSMESMLDSHERFAVVSNVKDAIALGKEICQRYQQFNAIWVIGGARIYKHAMPFCNKAVITTIYDDAVGDTLFPIGRLSALYNYMGGHDTRTEGEDTPHIVISYYARNKNVILPEEDTAATYKTDISGWVSGDGRYFGVNEDTARYSGSTHRECPNCESIIAKNSYCAPCSFDKRAKKHRSAEKQPWDGTTPVYAECLDQYFRDSSELFDLIEDEGDPDPRTMMLYHCKPVKLSEVDESYFLDDLGEDAELPEAIRIQLDALNKTIRETQLDYFEPTRVAVEFLEENLTDVGQ